MHLEYLIDFLDNEAVEDCKIYEHLKCAQNEAKLLQMMTKEYVLGSVDVSVSEI